MKTRVALLVTAVVCIIVLPSFALGAGGVGFTLLAQMPGPIDAATALGDKSIAYWFLALAAVAIISWTWIVNWLIKQLESQRAAHAETQNKLIDFMAKDHAEMRALLGRTTEMMDRVITKLG